MSDRQKELLRKMHDVALENMPEGAEHTDCDICKADTASNSSPDQETGGDHVDKETLTKEEHAQALAAALKPLQDEIAKLKSERASDETQIAIDAAVETAKAESKKEIDELTNKFDTAELEKNAAIERAEKAEKEVADTKTYLESEVAKAEEAAAREGRMAERIEKVKEVASFDEDQIEARKERWADMEQADFDSILDDYKSVAEKAAAANPTEPGKVESAMAAVAPETAKLQAGESALGFIGEARKAGFVPGKRF